MPANSHGGSTGEEIGTGHGGSYLWVTKRFPLCRSTQKLQRIAFAPEVFFGFFEGEQQGAKKGDAVIAAHLEAAKIHYFVSENRHFLTELLASPFQVLTSEEAIQLLR